MDEVDTDWETSICVCCGSQGVHIKCGNLNYDRPRWKCDTCRSTVTLLLGKTCSIELEILPIPNFKRLSKKFPNSFFFLFPFFSSHHLFFFPFIIFLDSRIDYFTNRPDKRYTVYKINRGILVSDWSRLIK